MADTINFGNIPEVFYNRNFSVVPDKSMFI